MSPKGSWGCSGALPQQQHQLACPSKRRRSLNSSTSIAFFAWPFPPFFIRWSRKWGRTSKDAAKAIFFDSVAAGSVWGWQIGSFAWLLRHAPFLHSVTCRSSYFWVGGVINTSASLTGAPPATSVESQHSGRCSVPHVNSLTATRVSGQYVFHPNAFLWTRCVPSHGIASPVDMMEPPYGNGSWIACVLMALCTQVLGRTVEEKAVRRTSVPPPSANMGVQAAACCPPMQQVHSSRQGK